MSIIWLAQLGALALAVWCFIDATKSKKLTLFTFILADAFAFEWVVLRLFHSLTYNHDLVQASGIPLIVVLGWCALLYSVYRIFEAFPAMLHAAIAGIVLVGIDLCLDPIAASLGWWHWNYPSGWIGVPYNNYFAWLSYSTLIIYWLRILPPANVRRIVFLFMTISGLGLLGGYAWNAIGVSIQPLVWWLIFVCTFITVGIQRVRRPHSVLARRLLLIPVSFLIFCLYVLFTRSVPYTNTLLVAVFAAALFLVFTSSLNSRFLLADRS